MHRPDEEFLRDLREMEFKSSSPVPQILHSHSSLQDPLLNKMCLFYFLQRVPLGKLLCLLCGAESLAEMKHPFTDTSQLRVAHNVYLAVYTTAQSSWKI